MVGLTVQARALGAEMQVCPPADQEFAVLMAGVVPLVPTTGPVPKATPPSAPNLPPRAVKLIAAQPNTVAPAAEDGHAPVATGLMPTGAWR